MRITNNLGVEKIMKKGQTALEYLITYGWAILIILVVLAVLWYYGVFDPSKWAGEQKYCPSKFLLRDAALTLGAAGAGSVDVVLGNRVGDAITIDGLNITLDGAGLGDLAPAEDVAAGGQSTTLTVPIAAGLDGYKAGDIVNMEMKVEFTNKKTTVANAELCTISLQAG